MKKLEETNNDSESKNFKLRLYLKFSFFCSLIRQSIMLNILNILGPKDVVVAKHELTQKYNEEMHELERELDKNVCFIFHASCQSYNVTVV